MEDFLQEKPTKKRTHKVMGRGYRRVFVLVFAIALLWQAVSLMQCQLKQYHQALAEDFKVVLAVAIPASNETLQAWGESLNAKEDILSVNLFSAQDGLAALQIKNPRLAAALVALGREQMPAYFELKLKTHTLSNVQLFTQNLAAEYPQLKVHYSQPQAAMAYYSGLCLRALNFIAVGALVLFVIFMLLVEAYPLRGSTHVAGAVVSALLAGICSLVLVAVCLYPTGLLVPAFQHFTSAGRQILLLVFCTLLGWTLGKWQKY